MPTRDQVLDRKSKDSARVSEQCRYIGFGIAIACFSLLTSTSTYAVRMVATYKVALIISALLGCFTVLFDMLQYLMGYLVDVKALKTGPNASGEYFYDDASLAYQARVACYWLKFIFVFIGSLGLVIIMVMSQSQ